MSRRKRSSKKRTEKSESPSHDGRPNGKRFAIGLVLIAGVVAVVVWARSGDDSNTVTDGASNPSPHVAENAVASSTSPLTDSASAPVKSSRSWSEIDDPMADGWDTEVFSSAASAQLKVLGKLLIGTQEIEASRLLPLVTADFTCQPLRPDKLSTVFRDKTIRVQRAKAASTPDGATTQGRHRGAKGLADALTALKKPFVGAKDLRFKSKLFRVQRIADSFTTRQYFSVYGRTTSGGVELNATWSARWVPKSEGGLPRLAWIGVKQFELAETQGIGGTLFSDCTDSVLSSNESYGTQICRGMNHWLPRGQDTGMYRGKPGVAVEDVNGDGLDDLFLCQEWGLPNRLFIQNPDGTLRDTSVEAGVDWLQESRSALLVDLDNDGDQDLIVAMRGALVLASNDGKGNFVVRKVLEVNRDTASLSAVDYDRDGRLDLYVCVYSQDSMTGGSVGVGLGGAAGTFVYHDANDGGANHLFRNQIVADDQWHFVDVTNGSGLDVNNHRWSLAAAWEDFDNDGDQDLYVANDYGRNNLYRNDTPNEKDAPPRFVDIAASAGVEDTASGMSVTWADYDRDGLMDVYVSNMFSAAGNRITFQDQFKTDATAEVKARLQRFARGNTLLKNTGGTFTDTSEAASVTMGRWAWGANFFDINNDGWEDLVVANGFITTDDTSDL
jgi:hypothetical protein